jgi:endoglycosylceramidase
VNWMVKMPWLLASCLFVGPQLGVMAPAAPSAAAVEIFPLHVANGHIVGPEGQRPWFRGVNVNGLVSYNPNHPESVAIDPQDFAEMHALGFNLIRLPLSLSALEPSPGKFSEAYLAKIGQVLAWAKAQGIWVILDMHQDRYAASLYPGEADGFPQWMVETFGLKTTPILGDITDPAVQGAFTSFWLDRSVDGHGLQWYYLQALKTLASRFAHNSAVAGYDVMNEPNPGFFPPLTFAATVLFPFYRQAISTIRSVSPAQPIFLEPDVVSMMAGYAAWPKTSWFGHGVVFEPHMYTGTYRGLDLSHFLTTLGAHLVNPMIVANLTPWNGTLSSLAIAYQQAKRLASREKAPFLVGEFGDSPTQTGNLWLEDEVRLQNRYRVGGLLWLWQIRAGSYPWGLVTADGGLGSDPLRTQIMASPHPLVVG